MRSIIQNRHYESDSQSETGDSDSRASEDDMVGFRAGRVGESTRNGTTERIKLASPPQSTNILTKLQDTRQYIDELVEENEVCALMWVGMMLGRGR